VTHVGKKLRHIRKNMRITQEELADGICNRSYVSQIEKGNVVPSPEILEQLAKKLNTDLKDLWEEVVNPGFTQVEIQNALRHVVNRIDENDWEIARKWLFKLNGLQLSPPEQCMYLWAKAEIQRYDKRLEDVENLYKQCIELARGLDNPTPLIRALNSLGFYYCQELQPVAAVPLLNEARQLATRFEISGLVYISVLYTSAMMHGRLEEYYSAIEYYKQAERLNIAHGTMYKSCQIFMGLAICYRHLKQYEEAEKYNFRALEVLRFLPNPQLEAAIYNNLGIYYAEINNLSLAEEYLQKALALQRSNFWKNNSSVELAKVYRLQARLEEAAELCENVLKENDSEFIAAEAQLGLANILNDQEKVEQALDHLENALAYFIRENNKSSMLKCYQALVKISNKGRFQEKITGLCETYELL